MLRRLNSKAGWPQSCRVAVGRIWRWIYLPQVASPTLLVVGSLDHDVIRLNEQALAALTCSKKLEIVQGAGHLFEEPGTLDIAVIMPRIGSRPISTPM